LIRKTGTIILAIIFILNLTACGAGKATRYEAEFLELFDTMTKIVGYSDNKEEFTKFSQLIYDDLKRYHQLYDIYNDYNGFNNMKTINDNAGIKPVKVDRKIIDLLLFGRDWYKNTNGKVNIAYGAVLSIWHHYREAGTDDPDNAELPPMNQLREASRHTDINKMFIDQANSTVFLEDPEMSLDVGAIGKGYAAEQVSRHVMQSGYTSALISVGGNVRAIGNKADSGKSWNAGIQNPHGDSSSLKLPVVSLADDSLVTSGDYERYYTIAGKNYHHIIDPETLFPAAYFTSVTIICKDSGIADALSTSVFNMPYEQGLKLIESLPDVDALWIFKDDSIKYSSHFNDFIHVWSE
jgi:thiamine biosynthesis lipoprotein